MPALRTIATRWQRLPRGVILAAIVLVAIGLFFPLHSIFKQQAAARAQARFQASLVADVRHLGGKVSFSPYVMNRPSSSLTIDAVDLADTAADGALLERLCQLPTIQRLNLDGAKMAKGDLARLTRLSNLESLSLARTSIDQADVVTISRLPRLKTLNLRETTVGDEEIASLAGMTSLRSLDLSQTNITPDGIKVLPGLPSLCTISLDEDCFTSESVSILQSLGRLQMVEVCVSNGMGKDTKNLLSGKFSSSVQACNANGVVLWNVGSPWEETLAGVVEIVIEELALDSTVRDRLINAMTDSAFNANQFAPVATPMVEDEEDVEITSCSQFLDTVGRGYGLSKAARAYAQNKFTPTDIPKLLEALRELKTSEATIEIRRYQSCLLARYGMDHPDAIHQLENNLNHESSLVRSTTVYGFGQWTGKLLFDNWTPSEKLADFAVPHLVRLSEDESDTVRQAASEVLGDLAVHHSKHAATALQALVGIIRTGNPHYSIGAISRIAETNRDRALTVLPELNRMLANSAMEVPRPLVEQLRAQGMGADAGEFYYRQYVRSAIAAIARYSPSVSKDLAVEWLEVYRLRKENVRVPLEALIAKDTPQTAAIIVLGLLDIAGRDDDRNDPIGANGYHARSMLGSICHEIRNWRFPPATRTARY